MKAATSIGRLVLLLLTCLQLTGCPWKSPEILAIPPVAMWRSVNRDLSVSPPRITIEAVALCGEKWRDEMASGDRRMVLVFDGRTFASSVPAASAALVQTYNPLDILRSTQGRLRDFAADEALASRGRHSDRYFWSDPLAEVTVVIDPVTKFPLKISARNETAEKELTYRLIPYDVKAHEKELFDVTQLNQYFEAWLASPSEEATPAIPSPPPNPGVL